MNWNVFYFVLIVGFGTGLLVRGGRMSRFEAWSLVIGRVIVGVILGLKVPAEWNGMVFVWLGVSEVGRVCEFVLWGVLTKFAVKREGQRWLHP